MNPNYYDMNHDGKVDAEDAYLMYEITEGEDTELKEDPCRPAAKSSFRVGGLLVLVLAGAYLTAFLKGSTGFGIIRLLLAILCVVAIIKVIGEM